MRRPFKFSVDAAVYRPIVWCAVLIIGATAAGSPLEAGWQESPPAAASSVEASESGVDREEAELIRGRIQTIALLCGLVLALIVIAFGYFRLDHATRGIYSRRLLVFALLLMLLVALAVVVSLSWIWR